MSRILLTHSPEAMRSYYGDRALAGLRALGEVKLHQGAEPLEGEALIRAAADCDLVVSYRQSPAPAALFEALPRLVAFQRCAVDIRNVDVGAASKAGVLVTQASAGFAPAVTELVLGFMVDLARGISASAMAYRRGAVPVPGIGRQLAGSTLGIIGYGAIGRRLAATGVALGLRVLVCDPHVKADAPGVEQVALEQLLNGSDFVVPLAVANEETENLMGAAQFEQMKPGACFINVSRGGLVDEAALARALDSGRIGGCALDVGRAPDQMPTPSLAARGDVIATPHLGGLTLQAIEHQSLETVAQAAEILKGRAPKGAVNADQWKRKELLQP
ncbi:MAG: NAD(P)-dependent oxidoreductase [Betaproteobacteria bacterium]